MTAPAPLPGPHDKEALRQWTRDNRQGGSERDAPKTPEELTALQRRRLLQNFGMPAEPTIRHRLDVALTGDATAEHNVKISVLGPFLTNLQEAVSAVAQALTGRPTSSAAIPRDIRDLTALSAMAMFPSSFGVTLAGPEGEAALLTDPRAVLDKAVDAVLDIVDSSEALGPTDDLLAEQLVPLGQRAMKHLGSLAAGLADAHLGLVATWCAQGGRSRTAQLTPAGAQRVRYLCEQSEFSEAETVTIVGWLGSASALRGTVELRTDSGEVIKARTDEDLTPRLTEFFNNRVEAEVEVTSVRSAGGRERKIYAVLRLRNR